MSYGKWIDQVCLSEDDFSFYRDEARKLAQLATDYWAMFQQSPEGRAMLADVKVPNDPIYRAGFDSTDGHMAAQIWNSRLTFIPPTKEYQHAA